MDFLKSLKETNDELFVAKNELVDTRLKLAQLKRILRLELGYDVVNPHLITKPTCKDRIRELGYLKSEQLKLVDYLRENDPRYLKDLDINPTRLSASTEYLLTAEQEKALKHLYHDRTVYRTDNEKKVGGCLSDYFELKEKYENQLHHNEVLKREIDATKKKISNFQKILQENKYMIDNIAKGCFSHVSPRKISPETDTKSKNIMDSEELEYKQLWENSELEKQKVIDNIDALEEKIEQAIQRIITTEAASTRNEIKAKAFAGELKQGKMLGKLQPERKEASGEYTSVQHSSVKHQLEAEIDENRYLKKFLKKIMQSNTEDVKMFQQSLQSTAEKYRFILENVRNEIMEKELKEREALPEKKTEKKKSK